LNLDQLPVARFRIKEFILGEIRKTASFPGFEKEPAGEVIEYSIPYVINNCASPKYH